MTLAAARGGNLEGDASHKIGEGAKRHYQWACYGDIYPGLWDIGFYDMDFYIQGDFVARGSFEIYD